MEHTRSILQIGTTNTSRHDEGSKSKKLKSDTFPLRLHNMLNEAYNQDFEDVVCWQKDGKSFKVHDKDRLTLWILPKYFQGQTHFKSFQRQLNIYGFTRQLSGPNKGAYSHRLLVRGKPETCRFMVRTKVKNTGITRGKLARSYPKLSESSLDGGKFKSQSGSARNMPRLVSFDCLGQAGELAAMEDTPLPILPETLDEVFRSKNDLECPPDELTTNEVLSMLQRQTLLHMDTLPRSSYSSTPSEVTLERPQKRRSSLSWWFEEAKINRSSFVMPPRTNNIEWNDNMTSWHGTANNGSGELFPESPFPTNEFNCVVQKVDCTFKEIDEDFNNIFNGENEPECIHQVIPTELKYNNMVFLSPDMLDVAADLVDIFQD